jgi:two-component system nitrate/nitrite response regulator NarL
MGDNELLLEGLKRILVDANFCDEATVTGIDDMFSVVLAEDRPIVLIINIGEDYRSVLEQVQLLKTHRPTVRVCLLDGHSKLDDEDIVAAFRCGANAYCPRPTCDNLLKSLELVMDGEAILPATTLSHILREKGLTVGCEIERSATVKISPIACVETPGIHSPRLSTQEQCILRCLIEGDSNKIIARKHDITEATVKVHVKAILRKIRLNNRTQAAIWGINNGGFMNAIGKGNGASSGPSVASMVTHPYRPLIAGATADRPTSPS